MAKATSPQKPKPEQAPGTEPVVPKTLPDETTTQEGGEDDPGIEVPKKPPPPLTEP